MDILASTKMWHKVKNMPIVQPLLLVVSSRIRTYSRKDNAEKFNIRNIVTMYQVCGTSQVQGGENTI
jgi:hypothetical protein